MHKRHCDLITVQPDSYKLLRRLLKTLHNPEQTIE